ncbi:MAG: hypothetical protein NVSMB10_08730 [Steroidobacteraceae bacterium]
MKLDRAEWNDALGTLLTYCADPAGALPFYERAVGLAAHRSGYRYNLATAQRMLGDLAGAEANLDQVITAAPHDVQAYYTRADLRVQTGASNHIDAMVSLMRGGVRQPHEDVMLCFALAKELEDVARYEEAFLYLKRGCDLKRRSMVYEVKDDVATIEKIIEVHARITREAPGDMRAADPIFVIGLPRSGTTLVQQILASHSAVQAAGELQAFPAVTMAAVHRRAGRAVGKLEFVERAWDLDPPTLGQDYLNAVLAHRSGQPRFVDKQPLNYLYAGLIVRALPRARIIALSRDPMDSCYAMYKSLFTNAYPFSYDLDELGQYFGAWHRLLRHWQLVLGDRLLIVRYEDLIASQAAVSRRIVGHCGLEWEDACLAFHVRPGAVTTASAAQVRRGLYSSSVGRWRCFERQLAPLAARLKSMEPPGGWSLGGE